MFYYFLNNLISRNLSQTNKQRYGQRSIYVTFKTFILASIIIRKNESNLNF